MFDSLTFRMRREENQEEDENDGEEDGEEKEKKDGVEGLLELEKEVVEDDGGGGGVDDGVEEQWSQALRLILSQGYGIHGDHYDPSLAGGEGLLIDQYKDKGQTKGKDKDKGQTKGKDKDKGSHRDKKGLRQGKDKGSDKDKKGLHQGRGSDNENAKDKDLDKGSDNEMNIQNYINMLVNWYHKDDISSFNHEYREITEGEQFPSKKEVSKQLDIAINRFDGHKISTDFSSNNKEQGMDKGSVRLYSCQQSLMKMHPLFDHAIAKVPNPPPNPLALLSKQPCAIIKTALRYYQTTPRLSAPNQLDFHSS